MSFAFIGLLQGKHLQGALLVLQKHLRKYRSHLKRRNQHFGMCRHVGERLKNRLPGRAGNAVLPPTHSEDTILSEEVVIVKCNFRIWLRLGRTESIINNFILDAYQQDSVIHSPVNTYK